MRDAIESFLQLRGHLSPTTQGIARYWLDHFQRFLESRWPTAADLERYQQCLLWRPHRRGRLYSPNTVDQALRFVRALLRWATAQGLLAHDPSQSLVLPRPPQPEQPLLSQGQVLKLLNLPDVSKPLGMRDSLILELLYGHPLSAKRCLALRVDQVVGESLVLGELHFPLDCAWPAMERYLNAGRPQLDRYGSPKLLLRDTGRDLLVLSHIFRYYAQRLGLPHRLDVRTLQRSYRQHIKGLEKRSPF